MSKLPEWAGQLAEQYRGGTMIEFIVYGNIDDKVEWDDSQGAKHFTSLRKFIAKKLFPRRDAVIYYDPSHGISFRDDETFGEFHRVVQAVDASSGTRYAQQGLPRDANRALYLVERFMRAKVDPRGGAAPKSVGVIIEFADLILPAGDPGHMSMSQQSTLVTLLRWAQDPVFLDANLTVVLVADNLALLNQSLVESPFIGRVEVKLPDQEERKRFLTHKFEQNPTLDKLTDIPIPQFAQLTGGLSRVNLNHLTSQAVANEQRITPDYVGAMKKQLIEKECFGMLEFLTSPYGLDTVCGHVPQKQWLRDDAKLIKEGKVDALPMGYLLCGPVGTGKTFMAQCYTHDIGIPCVKLNNFRSQWYGSTEANWQKILGVLVATGPVGVIIDEADAAVGDRESGHEVSNRVFSMLATQMGDTRYRGHIMWFLLTSRPDLLPVDLKRQGRAEVHIPLFYPDTDEERRQMREVLVKKCKIDLEEDALDVDIALMAVGNLKGGNEGDEESDPDHEHGPDCEHEHDDEDEDEDDEFDDDEELPVWKSVDLYLDDSGLSGAEIESILIRSKRRAYLNGHPSVTKEDLELESKSYIPNLPKAQIELQILAAVVECSDKRFLPKRLAAMPRSRVRDRMRAIKRALASNTDIREGGG